MISWCGSRWSWVRRGFTTFCASTVRKFFFLLPVVLRSAVGVLCTCFVFCVCTQVRYGNNLPFFQFYCSLIQYTRRCDSCVCTEFGVNKKPEGVNNAVSTINSIAVLSINIVWIQYYYSDNRAITLWPTMVGTSLSCQPLYSARYSCRYNGFSDLVFV